jgi:hypothetical protein
LGYRDRAAVIVATTARHVAKNERFFFASQRAGDRRARPLLIHRNMNPKVSLAALVATVVPAFAAAGCAAEYTTADGYDAAYVDAPPATVTVAPAYTFAGGYVYEGGGRYYHPYRGRWVTYRHLPRGAVRIEGRAVYPRR